MAEALYKERRIQRRFFGFKVERPKAKPGQVLVLTGGGAPIILQPNRKATAGEAAWNGYDTIYEIDMGQRDIEFTASVPAKEGDVSFQLKFSAGYRVSDPVAIINEQINNPDSLIKRVVTESASRVTAGYEIENSPDALDALRQMLDKRRYTSKLPFVLSAISIKLELDSEARNFLSIRRERRREAILAQETTELSGASHELNVQKQKYEMELQQKEREFELELQKREVEMQLEIQQRRIAVYEPMIKNGMWAVLVQQLAQNPDDISRVADVMLQADRQQRETNLVMLNALIEGDIIEDRHVRDVTDSLIRNIRSQSGLGQLEEQEIKQIQ